MSTNETKQLKDGEYKVRHSALPELDKRIARVNKRAARIGTKPITYTITADYAIKRKYEDLATGEMIEEVIRMVHILPAGEAPIINGWTFAATIVHDESGNLLKTVPTFDKVLPTEFRNSATERCDYCHIARNRSETFVLFNGTNWMQVGRSCLKDFLGHASPEALASWASTLSDLESVFGGLDEGYSSGRTVRYHMLNEVVELAAMFTRTEGYLSKSAVAKSGMGIPTSSLIATVLTPFSDKDRAYSHEKRSLVSDQDREKAIRAIEWAQSVDTTRDYLWNIHIISTKEALEAWQIGYAASIVTAYMRSIGEETYRKRAPKKPSEHVGKIKKRDQFLVDVIDSRECESNWGVSTLFMMEDLEGNKLKWFCTGHRILDVGNRYTIAATVQKHDVYNGSKDTLINRVSVVKDHGDLPAVLELEGSVV